MKELTPCPQILPAIEKIALGTEQGGIFMWYVRKHIEMCDHCKETLDAMTCYQRAIERAYEDAHFEGVDEAGLNQLLASLEA